MAQLQGQVEGSSETQENQVQQDPRYYIGERVNV